MTTETPAINYKIGNARLVRVTEKAARKLASLLEGKGKPNPALVAGSEVNLHELQAQSVTVRIIAKLNNRLLEK